MPVPAPISSTRSPSPVRARAITAAAMARQSPSGSPTGRSNCGACPSKGDGEPIPGGGAGGWCVIGRVGGSHHSPMPSRRERERDGERGEATAMDRQLDLLAGTLDMLILKAVSLGPLHGYGILLRIEQISKDRLDIQQGSLYPALYRLEHQGWIASEWGESENKRRAKYYRLDRKSTRLNSSHQ